MSIIQKCRICGCTQNNINPNCVEMKIINGEQWFRGCYWVEFDLCSAKSCVKTEKNKKENKNE